MTIKRTVGHLINCKEATHLVSRMQDRPLGLRERILLRLHLAACKACTRFEQQMRFLRDAVAKYRE